MLKKLLFLLSLILVSFGTGYATAHSYFLNKKLPRLASAEPAPAPSATTLSPDEFKNQSQLLQEKKNQALSEQLKQELAKTPPPPTPTEGQAPSSDEATKTLGHDEPQNASPTGTKTEPTKKTIAAPTGPQPAAAPMSAPSPGEIYTGFQEQGTGTAPSTNSPETTESKKSGWDIKY